MSQKIATLFFVTLTFLVAGCSSQPLASPPSQSLTVFAAASLTEAFSEMAAEFETAHPGTEIITNFAGSQTLRLQIEQGAQVDVFASANNVHIEALVEAGLVTEPVTFTQNQLIVIMPVSNPAAIKTLADLSKPGLKLILADSCVPVGRYAREALDKLNDHPNLEGDYSARVLQNLVSVEDNVKSVVAKVQLGEADAGIVYASDVTPVVSAHLTTVEIPQEFNVLASYPVSVAAESDAPALAQQFVQFALSSRGQTLLAHHGFSPSQIQAIGQEP